MENGNRQKTNTFGNKLVTNNVQDRDFIFFYKNRARSTSAGTKFAKSDIIAR